jgi:hypothetical protein
MKLATQMGSGVNVYSYSLVKTCCVFRTTWVHLNGVLRKSLPSVCICILLSLLGNGSVNTSPWQGIEASIKGLLDQSFSDWLINWLCPLRQDVNHNSSNNSWLQVNIWQYNTACHLKMALGPKHVVAVTTEEEGDCNIDGSTLKLDQVQGLPSNATLFPWLFTILFN